MSRAPKSTFRPVLLCVGLLLLQGLLAMQQESEMILDTSVLLEKPSDSSILPLPQQDSSNEPKLQFTIENQPPLGGGSPVPIPSLIEGDAAQPSVSEVIANTMQKRPAMMLGLPMVADTGVSQTAKPITVYRGAAGNMGTKALTEGEKEKKGNTTTSGSKLPQRGIDHHGGDVMLNSTVYVIFYGSWDCNNVTACPSNKHTPQLVIDFLQSINGTSWMDTASSYFNKKGQSLTSNVRWGGHTFVSASDPDGCYLGVELDDSNVFDIVTCSLTAQKLRTMVNGRFKPIDPDGIYFVITTADVNVTSGFCDFYCGWHSNAAFHKQNIRYSFVGSPLQCPKGCMQLQKNSPNNVAEADGLVSILAHELIETVTDPDGDAWYDPHGQENADKCAWNYGHVKQVGNTYYNVGPWKCPPDMGASDYCINDGRKWLIQTNWVNAGDDGYCAPNYP